MNPDSPVEFVSSHNTLSIVLAQMVVLPPKSRVVMGRILKDRQCQDLPQSVVVEPVPTKNPGVYVARVASDVYVRSGPEFFRMSEAPGAALLRLKAGSLEGFR
jgi:hypothetical protein